MAGGPKRNEAPLLSNEASRLDSVTCFVEALLAVAGFAEVLFGEQVSAAAARVEHPRFGVGVVAVISRFRVELVFHTSDVGGADCLRRLVVGEAEATAPPRLHGPHVIAVD